MGIEDAVLELPAPGGSPADGWADFLRDCLSGVTGASRLRHQHKLFLAAGQAALAQADKPGWSQFGLTVAPGQRRALYSRLAEMARQLLDRRLATDFFFMHKPPGLRIRFQGASRAALDDAVTEYVSDWSTVGLLSGSHAGVYEPETAIFGGPSSMECVHRFFTHDSLGWLDQLAAPSDLSPWRFSLHTLRALFDGLEIVGWEDLGVWNQVRQRTGRQLSAPALGTPEFAAAATGIRSAWRAADVLRPELRPHLERCRASGARWLEHYFQGGHAELGPREAVAMAIIFHWNRGGLSLVTQASIAEALSDRSWP
jgi:thiopeptide-type bacteriocin biosynthesis protein